MTKILISPGFGAGWSTWADDFFKEFMLKDSTLIEMAERGASEEEVGSYIREKYPDDYIYIYTGGWSSIEVVELPSGALFKVNEYDGSESIECKENNNWMVA
jgi:hypothetical protein